MSLGGARQLLIFSAVTLAWIPMEGVTANKMAYTDLYVLILINDALSDTSVHSCVRFSLYTTPG